MMERGPRIISSSPSTLWSSHTSNLIMIVGLLFLFLHESLITIMLRMIHQPGASTSVGIDLHLGQKPKLGGRYTDISLIYISYSVETLYIHVSVSFFFIVVLVLFLLSKTQKDQKYFCCFSLFVSLVSSISLLHFLVSVCYSKIQKDFALFAVSFCSCFRIRKPKNICCSSPVL